MAKKHAQEPPHVRARLEGFARVRAHPLLRHLAEHAGLREDARVVPEGWAGVTASGTVVVNPDRRGSADEWAYVFAHLLLHLGFGHFPCEAKKAHWNAACDVVVAAFLAPLKLGRAPPELVVDPELYSRDERALYRRFLVDGIPPSAGGGCAGPTTCDLLDGGEPYTTWRGETWQDLLAAGLRAAVAHAVDVAGGVAPSKGGTALSTAERARRWFMASFPLLGSLATAFRLVEDLDACRRMDVGVAAVSETLREVYVNPLARLSEDEARFVLAHELLHVGLRHTARRAGRDPYLWNVACDFVINGWLHEMRVGVPPRVGVLLDGELAGLSAESIYDRIVGDMRRFRRLATLRGTGLVDVLDGTEPRTGDPTSLDAFFRQCLAQGLLVHRAQGRGTVPAGLVEEIWAVAEPPIPWDVALARLFDAWFPPIASRRTYARPSRRQDATPDIPRPRTAMLDEHREGRTFAVVLDTSGSMDRSLLARALGAIASYAASRDVALVRLVYCDAAPYDEGFVAPESLLRGVDVKGRGGTVLQPAIDLVDRAADFPPDGPILVVTDGECDLLHVPRPHAYVVPRGARLPFPPKGPVFPVD